MKKLFTFLLILYNAVCFAQWNSNPSINTVICNTLPSQTYQQIIPDGIGGAFVTWMEEKSANSAHIYAQHISQEGYQLWPPAGIPVSTHEVSLFPLIINDGNGGAIISWIDNQNGILKHYAQKVSADGNLLWPADGIAVCPAEVTSFFTFKMISDGDGGAIVLWDDTRNIHGQVYGQRLAADGSHLWPAEGLPCSPEFVPYGSFDAITDTTTNGVFLSWPRVIGVGYYSDIFVQRITGEGTAVWGTDGMLICHALKDQLYNKMISDGKGGIILLWQDFREDPVLSGIYGQRVDSAGAVRWSEDGKMICDSIIPASTLFKVVSDGTGGGIVAWLDDFIADQSNINNLYAQRFDSTGEPLWPAGNKIGEWEDIPYLSAFQMISDNKEGAFITWNSVSDTLPSSVEIYYIYDVYAQHLLPDGLAQWPNNGRVVSSATKSQINPQIILDEDGVALISWSDLRALAIDSTRLNYDIYAAKLTDAAVPVSWLSFAAVRNGNSHILKWRVANEYNSKGFFIERSADGIHYKSMGFVNAAGKASYTFTDDAPLAGNNYYRLKQVDADGKFKYSKIIGIYLLLEEVFSVYPSPVSKILKVKTNSTEAMLHIFNSYGEMIKTKSIDARGITEIDVSNVPAGIYFINTASGRMIGKFVKQ